MGTGRSAVAVVLGWGALSAVLALAHPQPYPGTSPWVALLLFAGPVAAMVHDALRREEAPRLGAPVTALLLAYLMTSTPATALAGLRFPASTPIFLALCAGYLLDPDKRPATAPWGTAVLSGMAVLLAIPMITGSVAAIRVYAIPWSAELVCAAALAQAVVSVWLFGRLVRGGPAHVAVIVIAICVAAARMST